MMNLHLKEIAKIAGINKNLTVHVARHTFEKGKYESAKEMKRRISFRTNFFISLPEKINSLKPGTQQ
jgi:hypothetical protein